MRIFKTMIIALAVIFPASAKSSNLIKEAGNYTLKISAAVEYACKFACNNDPLRGGFRVQ